MNLLTKYYAKKAKIRQLEMDNLAIIKDEKNKYLIQKG